MACDLDPAHGRTPCNGTVAGGLWRSFASTVTPRANSRPPATVGEVLAQSAVCWLMQPPNLTCLIALNDRIWQRLQLGDIRKSSDPEAAVLTHLLLATPTPLMGEEHEAAKGTGATGTLPLCWLCWPHSHGGSAHSSNWIANSGLALLMVSDSCFIR